MRIELPKQHLVVHENTLARLRGVIAAFHDAGDLSDFDFESIEAAIVHDERNTMDLMLSGGGS